jgi:hypothetical protein
MLLLSLHAWHHKKVSNIRSIAEEGKVVSRNDIQFPAKSNSKKRERAHSNFICDGL